MSADRSGQSDESGPNPLDRVSARREWSVQSTDGTTVYASEDIARAIADGHTGYTLGPDRSPAVAAFTRATHDDEWEPLTGSSGTSPARLTDDVLDAVRRERLRQIRKGWTPQHDDRHSTHDLVRLADRRAHSVGSAGNGYYSRERLIEATAMLVAAIEAIDRREEAARG